MAHPPSSTPTPSQDIRLQPVLTKLTVRNFKGLAEAEIELGNPVVFVGPNDVVAGV